MGASGWRDDWRGDLPSLRRAVPGGVNAGPDGCRIGRLDEPDDQGRRVRVTVDLQDEFALHQPLSLWALEAILELTEGSGSDETAVDPPPVAEGDGREGDELNREEMYAEPAVVAPQRSNEVDPALNVLSVIEAVQENPGVIVAAQVNEAKSSLMAEMKAAYVEYEERMERLAQVEAPKPNKDWTYSSFNRFRMRHPWVGGDTVKPKSIVRELYERSMTFGEYVSHYGLKRSEGAVLRYLSDVYKGLIQNVAEELRTEEIEDLTAWLGAVVRQVDSSLIDEWERLVDPSDEAADAPVRSNAAMTVMDDERAFRVMVRNAIFEWAQRLARRNGYDALVGAASEGSRFNEIEELWEKTRSEFTGDSVPPAVPERIDAALASLEAPRRTVTERRDALVAVHGNHAAGARAVIR